MIDLTKTSDRYEVVERKFWKLKAGFQSMGCPLPETVSIHGALPSPRNAYEVVAKGFTIYNKKENTYSNYFFGKVGIDTREEGEAIIARLEELRASYAK